MRRILSALQRPAWESGKYTIKPITKHALSTGRIPFPSERYFFPSEAAPHIRTLMAYPSAIIDIAHNISDFEPVTIFVNPDDLEEARLSLRDRNTKRITLNPLVTNHCWARDTGPVYVFKQNGDSARYAVDFNFNEWGGKLPGISEEGWDQDWPTHGSYALEDNAKFSRRVTESEGTQVKRVRTRLTLEGGGLVSDGEGTLLATESCILHDGRNPGWSKSEIEIELNRLLRVSKVIWFPGVKGEDVTDCHVDAVVGFVRPGVVLVSRPHKNSGKVWTRVYNEIIKVLSKSTDARGRKFEVTNLDEPDVTQFITRKGDEMCASRANFYLVNGGVIAPRFGDQIQDEESFEIMKQLWPDREIRPVSINAIGLGGGGIHCCTQQVPLFPA